MISADNKLTIAWFISVVSRGIFPDYCIPPTVFEHYVAVADIEVDGKSVELALWDTAGIEDYDPLRALSYPDTDVVLICFAIDSPTSLSNVSEKWISEVFRFISDVPRILVGLKKDLRDDPKTITYLKKDGEHPVSWEEGKKVAESIAALGYFECSAKTGEGVNEVFEAAVRQTLTETKKIHKGLRNWLKRFSSR
ncbi:hypothetical protein FNYG_15359 [Fusarium nygamai]|uniref:Uncharacterized protein n=1 Tax=Gibberella nygamai TaxID=42673 RepID=A0A2K0UF77_GIBNY|nr:hypothetical protein FNYG_15359 [Fusarium nygamai]